MIQTGKKIFQNIMVLSITDILAQMLSLVLMMVVARKLGPSLLGVHAFGVTFAMFIQIFLDYGLQPYIQREVGRDPDLAPSLLFQVILLKMGIMLAATVVILALLPFLAPSSPKREVVLLLSGAMFFQSNMAAVCAFFRARLVSHWEAVVRLSFRLTYTISGILTLMAGAGVITLASLEFFAMALAFFMAFWIFRRKIGPLQGSFSWSIILKLGKSTWNFLLINMFVTIFNSIDMIMLSMISGDVSTGYYSSACRLIYAFDFLPSAFMGAFLPVLSRQFVENQEDFHLTFMNYFKYVSILGIGLASVLAGVPASMIKLLFGASFVPATPTLVLMAMALMLTYINIPLSATIIALNREHNALKIFIICALTNVVLNWLVLPYYQDLGAALTTIVSQLLLLFLQAGLIGAELRNKARLAKSLPGL